MIRIEIEAQSAKGLFAELQTLLAGGGAVSPAAERVLARASEQPAMADPAPSVDPDGPVEPYYENMPSEAENETTTVMPPRRRGRPPKNAQPAAEATPSTVPAVETEIIPPTPPVTKPEPGILDRMVEIEATAEPAKKDDRPWPAAAAPVPVKPAGETYSTDEVRKLVLEYCKARATGTDGKLDPDRARMLLALMIGTVAPSKRSVSEFAQEELRAMAGLLNQLSRVGWAGPETEAGMKALYATVSS